MYRLTPNIHPKVGQILADKQKVRDLLTAFGSPLNLIYPQIAVENLHKFQEVFNSHKIRGEVQYAYKANKSVAVLNELSTNDCKVDVASKKELQQVLSAGFNGSRIEATGPKDESFLRLLLQHGAMINLNSPSELDKILDIREKLGIKKPTRAFIRLQEFNSSQTNIISKDTKFGFSIQEAMVALEKLSKINDFNFIGFSFHLMTNSLKERLVAIEQALKLTLEAIKRGLDPNGVNIGGGFSVPFLKDSNEWAQYILAIKSALLDDSSLIMSWNNSGLGYFVDEGMVKGSANFSDFYQSQDQYQELDRILKAKLPTFGNVAQFFQENAFTLFIEPGRSLLDQVGITLASVQSVNKSLKGEDVVFLNMNRSHINSIELEFMSDPIAITCDEQDRDQSEQGVFLSGNLCLQHDFICRRKVFLGHEIIPGDILVFVNTAGYFMDFTESETIKHPIAQKVAVDSCGWSLDENYTPSIFKLKK